MRNLPNVEKSAFRKNGYVGYANGVWLINQTRFGGWKWAARPRDNPDAAPIYGDTLQHISTQLAARQAA